MHNDHINHLQLNCKTDNITEKIMSIATQLFGISFKARIGQLEIIEDILMTMSGKYGPITSYILEAPTGSGKSIIAMIISKYLNDCNLDGYILTSDKALQDQYANDLDNWNIDWGVVKGVDNYKCHVNDQIYSLGDCKIKKLKSYAQQELKCFDSCAYIQARNAASRSKTAILNYSYALIQRNYVCKNGDVTVTGKPMPFIQRDFVICDEAHKITDIIQSHFSPSINKKILAVTKTCTTFYNKNNYSSVNFYQQISKIYNFLLKENDNTNLLETLEELHNVLFTMQIINETIVNYTSTAYVEWNLIPIEYQDIIKHKDFIKDICCKIKDYIEIIKSTTIQCLIKTVDEKGTIIFNCLNEKFMMQSFFNKKFGFKIFMSATLGDLEQFAKNAACAKVRVYKLPSTFQYDKSPIWVKTNNHLNYKNIGTKYDVLASECEWILKKHSSEQGIIHTSSFTIGNEVYNLLSKESQERILLYTSTQEKEDYIRILKYDIKNRILMGPSILEGIDLPDNQSRFQIILKMPYPSLGNTFVKLKSEYDKSWYNMKTTLNILQGIGRSIRNPTDWAETYILDTNVIYLLKNRTFFSNEFLDRVKNYL